MCPAVNPRLTIPEPSYGATVIYLKTPQHFFSASGRFSFEAILVCWNWSCLQRGCTNMYAVIRHHKVKGPQADALARQGEEDFVPIIRKMPGFIAYTIIVGDDMVSTISIFEDKAAAEESTRRAEAWAAETVTDFDVPTEVIEGSVVVHEAP